MAIEPEAAQALFAENDFGDTAQTLDDFYGKTDSFLEAVHALAELEGDANFVEDEASSFPPELVDDLVDTHHAFIYGFQSTVRRILNDSEFGTRQDKAKIIASLMVYTLSGYSYDPDKPGSGLGTKPPENSSPDALARHKSNTDSHRIQSEMAFNTLNTWSMPIVLTGRYTSSPRANSITRGFNTFIANKASQDFGLELERDIKLPALSKVEVALLAGKATVIAGMTVHIIGSHVTRKSADLALNTLRWLRS